MASHAGPQKRKFSTEWRGSSLGRGTDPGKVLFPKDFHLFLLSSARRYSLVQRLHQESTILPSTRGIPEVFPFAGTTVEKHGLLLFRTRNSPFSFSLLLLSQDISKKKKMSYPSISKLIKNFQFSPHFDDRFETAISR